MKKTQILLLDAIREDYINKDLMPNLYNLKKKYTYLSMIPSIGYSNGAHSTIWSGLHQEKHGNFLIYHKTNKRSAFSKTGYILNLIPSYWIRLSILTLLKLPYYEIPSLKRNPPKWYKELIVNYPPGLPPKIAKFFAIGESEPNHKDTIFSILSKKDISFNTQTDMANYYFKKDPPTRVDNFNRTKEDVDIYYFYGGDGLGHVYGIESKEIRGYLKKVDKKIGELIKEDEDNFFIFSDHGMVEIKEFIDVKKYLDNAKLKLGKDYIAFYDATMVRFWVLNKNKEELLINIIKKIPKTTFFGRDLLKKYHLQFDNNKWFDYMLLMDSGVRPFPDYFVPVKWGIKAYHGYWPEYSGSQGVFITNTFKIDKKEINLVDIMPTILKSIGLEKEIPKDIGGKPIF